MILIMTGIVALHQVIKIKGDVLVLVVVLVNLDNVVDRPSFQY